MKFNSSVCTTREKSERLLKLGLKPETADMAIWRRRTGVEELVRTAPSDYDWLKYNDFIPAWSLHRLLCMLHSREDIYPIMPTAAYDDMICEIEIQIQCGTFNKEYLKGGAE